MNSAIEKAGRSDPSGIAPRWFCLRTRPKQEHLAAQQLRLRVEGVETYAPRIRYRKPTRRGTIWFIEALFPGYLFARFDPMERMRQVRHSTGITGVVAFGGKYAVVPDDVVERLRAEIRNEEIRVVTEPFHEGDIAEIVDGPFRGLEALIVRVLPARERVRVLLNFLGRETAAEISYSQIAKPSAHPLANCPPPSISSNPRRG